MLTQKLIDADKELVIWKELTTIKPDDSESEIRHKRKLISHNMAEIKN